MEKLLSYQYDEFMKYKNVNNMIPIELVEHCINNNNKNVELSLFGSHINNTILQITRGDNPDDIILKNTIKSYINKINKSNYTECMDKLKSLNYNTKENVLYLIVEITNCVIKNNISVKGFNFKEDYVSIPEICVNILKQFSSFVIQTNEGEIKFKTELALYCQKMFNNFMDNTKSLDEHNEGTTDDFKGFMTLLGLIYSKEIITQRAILDCMNRIKVVMFELNTQTNPEENLINRTYVECQNIYKGYDNLLNHVLNYLESKLESETRVNILDAMNDFINQMIDIHDKIDELNNIYWTLSKNKKVRPIRQYNLTLFNSLKEYMNKLLNKIKEVKENEEKNENK